MSPKSKSRIESFGIAAASLFYAVVGVICFSVLAVIDFRLVHIGIIGVLSLTAAYGVLRSKVWSTWVVVALFFIGTTFSVYTLYRTFWGRFLLDGVLVVYLFFTWVFTVYITTKR